MKFCGSFTFRFFCKSSIYRPEFSKENDDSKVHILNDFAPIVPYVGLTALKREKGACEHKNLLNATIVSTIGNVYDRYARNSERLKKFG